MTEDVSRSRLRNLIWFLRTLWRVLPHWREDNLRYRMLGARGLSLDDALFGLPQGEPGADIAAEARHLVERFDDLSRRVAALRSWAREAPPLDQA